MRYMKPSRKGFRSKGTRWRAARLRTKILKVPSQSTWQAAGGSHWNMQVTTERLPLRPVLLLPLPSLHVLVGHIHVLPARGTSQSGRVLVALKVVPREVPRYRIRDWALRDCWQHKGTYWGQNILYLGEGKGWSEVHTSVTSHPLRHSRCVSCIVCKPHFNKVDWIYDFLK